MGFPYLSTILFLPALGAVAVALWPGLSPRTIKRISLFFTAYSMYSARWLSPERVGRAFRPLYVLFSRKYYFDELYEKLLLGRGLLSGLFRGLEVVDRRGVDGVVNGVAGGSFRVGRAARRVQTGELQLYGAGIALGLLALFMALYIFG